MVFEKTLLYIFLVHRQSVYMFCFQTTNIEVGFWYLLPVTSCWIDSYLSFVYLFRNVSSSQKHKIHKWLKVNISFDIKKKSINWTLSPTVKFIHQCFKNIGGFWSELFNLSKTIAHCESVLEYIVLILARPWKLNRVIYVGYASFMYYSLQFVFWSLYLMNLQTNCSNY